MIQCYVHALNLALYRDSSDKTDICVTIEDGSVHDFNY